MDKLPVIIGGFYRTGSSLLRRLIDSHSSFHCGPEVKFFEDFYGNYLKDDLRHVRLFSTLATLGLSESEMLTIFGDAFVRSHELAAKKANKQRWADKNPHNVIYLEQWSNLLPSGFIFIHTTRNPFDILSSLKETRFPRSLPPDFADKVKLLKKFMLSGLEYTNNNPNKSITVIYEELVTKPAHVMTTIFDKLGENFEPEIFDKFILKERVNGIEDPKVKHSAFVHQNSVERWRHDLTEAECAIISTVIGEAFTNF